MKLAKLKEPGNSQSDFASSKPEKETDIFHNYRPSRLEMNSANNKRGRNSSKSSLDRKRRSRSKAIKIPNELVVGTVLIISTLGLQVILASLGVSGLLYLGGL